MPPSPETLEQVAVTSGGAFFEAPDAEQLSRVYEEPGRWPSARARRIARITDVFAALAAALLLVAGTASVFLFRRIA